MKLKKFLFAIALAFAVFTASAQITVDTLSGELECGSVMNYRAPNGYVAKGLDMCALSQPLHLAAQSFSFYSDSLEIKAHICSGEDCFTNAIYTVKAFSQVYNTKIGEVNHSDPMGISTGQLTSEVRMEFVLFVTQENELIIGIPFQDAPLVYNEAMLVTFNPAFIAQMQKKGYNLTFSKYIRCYNLGKAPVKP